MHGGVCCKRLEGAQFVKGGDHIMRGETDAREGVGEQNKPSDSGKTRGESCWCGRRGERGDIRGETTDPFAPGALALTTLYKRPYRLASVSPEIISNPA